ncbi:hexokinase [Auriculariales sp. MPI-PUGE-AT-0066]|nr:hexokinase [Auriculariales sp. MPI-PUGE-AT-0066]
MLVFDVGPACPPAIMSRTVKFSLGPDDIEEDVIPRPHTPPVSSSRSATQSPDRAPELMRHHSGASITSSGQPSFSRCDADTPDEFPHATKRTMRDYLKRYEEMFIITPQRMRIIANVLEETLEKGLKEPGQVVPMIPTWVFGWPTGNEKGDYLALDLGGTNLRVCLVTLAGQGQFAITQSKYRLSEEIRQGSAVDLFDYCATSVLNFITEHSGDAPGRLIAPGTILPLGFTFSYPCEQDRIDHAMLIRWTKGFGVSGAEGQDCGKLFQDALSKHQVPVVLASVINDTTGTLIASHYVDPSTRIGVILGTGCNAAYMEKVGAIDKIAKLGIDAAESMAINCEWGAFDSFTHANLPRTRFDEAVDRQSNKPGEQSFEKLISGAYLGEILRLVINELIVDGIIFAGQNTYKLEKPYSLDTAVLSMMESDTTDELLTIVGMFVHYYNLETTLSERQFFRALARLIGRRAARLAACGIGALVSKMDILEEGCSVGADGSLYNKYPGFAKRIHEGLVDIFGDKGHNITTHHAEDGSGVGSAIIAAMTKQRRDEGKYPQV